MPTRRIGWLALLGVLVLGAGFFWWTGFDPVAWWRLRSLARAGDANRADCAERLAELGSRTLPGLLGLLRSPDDVACQNARAALVCLVRRAETEEQVVQLVATLTGSFATLSPTGQVAVLSAPPDAVEAGREQPTPANRLAWKGLLEEVDADLPEEVRAAGLDLAGWVFAPGVNEGAGPVRDLVFSCLTARSPAVRLRAVQLSLLPGLDLGGEVAGLLRDPVVEVRRAAVLVAGPAEKVVLDEVLLPCLHDPDVDVQRLAEAALRGRGLTAQQLQLGRLLTDADPKERLRVLDHLNESVELEPSVWLRRLSHDRADSVRAAAVRMMAEQATIDLSDRLEQMRSSDPSPTVSQLASFYLRQRKE